MTNLTLNVPIAATLSRAWQENNVDIALAALENLTSYGQSGFITSVPTDALKPLVELSVNRLTANSGMLAAFALLRLGEPAVDALLAEIVGSDKDRSRQAVWSIYSALYDFAIISDDSLRSELRSRKDEVLGALKLFEDSGITDPDDWQNTAGIKDRLHL